MARRATVGHRWQIVQITRCMTMFFCRVSACARSLERMVRASVVNGSTDGIGRMYEGVRCSIVT